MIRKRILLGGVTAFSIFALLFSMLVIDPLGVSAVTVSNLSGKTSSALNLRSCASTSCSILKTIPSGTTLSFSATSGDWFKTVYAGKTGWVHSNYIILQGTSAKVISRGNVNRKMVAYTFDAGSDVGYAVSILNYLKSNNIKASFGLTGAWSQDNPAVVKRIASEGHMMMNHSWNHPSFTGYSTGASALSPAKRITQLVMTNVKIKDLTGKGTKPYFRPPYGDYNSSVLRDVGANGYSGSVMWSVDSLGWNGLTATQICNRVVNSMDADSKKGNGYIILFHVGSDSQDYNALPCITTALKSRGFSFGTVPQVIAN